jgi:phosphate-selective porin
MVKFALLVAGHPKLKLETSMLKTSNKSSKRVVTVIKNEHTKEQMNALDDEWLNSKGPIMTLAETLAYAAEKDKKRATSAS